MAVSNDAVDFEMADYLRVNNDYVDFTEPTTIAPNTPDGVAVTDDTVNSELTIDWNDQSDASGFYVYRAEASGSSTSDYTQIANVTAPPYTDTGLEDGEKYYYRISAYA